MTQEAIARESVIIVSPNGSNNTVLVLNEVFPGGVRQCRGSVPAPKKTRDEGTNTLLEAAWDDCGVVWEQSGVLPSLDVQNNGISLG